MSIESGSRDFEGLDKIGNLIADRLKALGGKVEMLDANQMCTRCSTRRRRSAAWCARRSRARARGKFCSSRTWIRCIAWACRRSSRSASKGDRAYGLGIADDKQGIAVILHTLAMLKGDGLPAITAR